MFLSKFDLTYQEVSDTFSVAKAVSEKYKKLDTTKDILDYYKVVYGTDIQENQNLRDAICDNISSPRSTMLRSSASIDLSEDKNLSIKDLINESVKKDHQRLKNLMTEALTSYFLEQNKSKKFNNEDMQTVKTHFDSLPLGKSFETYSRIYDTKKDRKFLDKDNMMDKLRILADTHKKPTMEELKNFEIKNMGVSDIKIEVPKNNGIKL